MKSVKCFNGCRKASLIPETIRNWRDRSICSFTLIEILMVVVILTLLISILMPSLQEARNKAKFTRWYAFNRALNNDPDCMINFNFQQGSGSVLVNEAKGCDAPLFNSRFYNGFLQNISKWNNKTVDEDTYIDPNKAEADADHNFEWIAGGRWGRYKHALQFNGVDTAVVIPSTQGANFSPYDNFTVMCWVKFDSCGNGDTPFAKSLWGTYSDAAAQYDMYINNYAASTGTGSFDVDCFRICGTWNDSDVDFKKGEWTHIALTYRYVADADTAGVPSPFQGDEVPPCEILAYINGQPLGAYIETHGENPGTCAATDWGSCYSKNVPVILGAAGGYRKYWKGSTYDSDEGDASLLNTLYLMPNFVLDGRVDEFLMFKRALKPHEVNAHWQMGHE